jgi:Helicase associated domain
MVSIVIVVLHFFPTIDMSNHFFFLLQGHCNVPKMYPPNQALGYWVNEQRSQYRRFVENKPSYITEDKVRALKEIGFKWSIRKSNTCSSNWDNWLKQLKAYKDEHGDTDVPLKYPKNIALGAFVNRQRTEYRKVQQGVHSSLTEKRINSLNELGFKWQLRVSRTPWEQRLEELREFKEEFGHCNVPSSWSKNQPLAYWVFKQRGQYRLFHENIVNGNSNNRCNMTEDRIAQLEELGFEWNPPRKSKFHSEQNESATF